MVTTPLSRPHISTTKHLPALTLTLYNISRIVISIFVIKIWFWILTPTGVREVQKVGLWKFICIAERTLRRFVGSGWFFGMMEWVGSIDDIWCVLLREAVVCGERWVWRSEDGADFAMSSCIRETSPDNDSLQDLTESYPDHFHSLSIRHYTSLQYIRLHQILKNSQLLLLKILRISGPELQSLPASFIPRI